MRICDLVTFSKENYFNGAVQTEWFYDQTKVRKIAASYVFHGPKYYGVSTSDLTQSQHKLIDTASFSKNIADKLYADKPSNSFVMTIAGYGTGKSHLAVCLGALFSGNRNLSDPVTDNIEKADLEIGTAIREINVKKNLILVLNGMSNFNLDAEVLKMVRKALELDGIDNSVLQSVTKAYDISRHFIKNTFSQYQNKFEQAAHEAGISKQGTVLMNYMLSHVEDDNAVVEATNKVYSEINGDSISWDRGISAGDILSIVQEKLCGGGKPYHKVLILFDEFGRYIEYAAANPAIAGEAALQQIFEAIQSANGKIIFTGFIQNDLSAYLSRIEKTATIIRYVGRYETSEKLYLSSNFETILANLLIKNENAGFSKSIGNALDRYERFHAKIQDALVRWDRSNVKKSVWTTSSLYRSVILEGCYPLHPITVWLLSNTSNWMQQRSTIAFAAEMFENIKRATIDGTWLPYVYPIDIVDSSIYNEMLNSEEKGLVQSQFCMLYRDINLKVGNKLSSNELSILKAILIINIAKFSFRDKDDAIQAIRYCSNVKEEEVAPALKNLEDMHGVIAFDANANTYDLIAEANGFNEFKLVYARRRVGVSATIDDCDSDILNELQLSSNVETSFAQEHDISTPEWNFERRLVDSKFIDEGYLTSVLRQVQSSYSGETPRGFLIYAYCDKNSDIEIQRISRLISTKNIEKEPIIVLFLDDAEHEVTDSLRVKKTFGKFSSSERERFQKHISNQIRSQNKKIIQKFFALIRQRQMLGATGLLTYEGRINSLCSDRFTQLYYSAPKFAFDGFQNKVTNKAKKYLSNICIKLFDRTLMNVQSYQALTQDEKNRVKACLSTGVKTSWQVFDNGCSLVKPEDSLMASIYDEVEEALSEDEPRSVMSLLGKYTKAPYGININAIALFVFYFIAQHGNGLFSFYGQEKLTAPVVSDKIFKGGKLQNNELLKIRIQVNANAEIDMIADLCHRILETGSINKFSKLKDQLDSLVTQEGISVENQSLVAQVNVRLDEGIKALRALEEKITKAEEMVGSSEQAFVIHKFVKVLEYLPDFSKPLSEEYNFTCDDELIKKAGGLKKRFESLLQQKFSNALTKLKCNITQLSQFKALYSKVADTLKINGYYEYSEATLQRISDLEAELIAQQKYESSLVELEKDMTLANSCLAFSYSQLRDMTAKIAGWKQFIQQAKELPPSIAKVRIEHLDNAEELIAERLALLDQNFKSVIVRFQAANTLEELSDAHEDVIAAIKQGYDSLMLKELDNCADRYILISKTIGELSESIDELRTYLSNEGPRLDKVIANETRRKIVVLEKKQQEWIYKYLEPIEGESRHMSAVDCINWMERTKLLPEYLESKTLERYSAIRAMVEDRLHTCKVDGVVSMFKQLSNDEKQRCLEIIKNLSDNIIQ